MAKTVADLAKDIAAQQPEIAPEIAPEIIEAAPAPSAAVPSEPTREAMLSHLAKEYGTTPDEVAAMLKVGDMPVARTGGATPSHEPPDPGGPRVPIKLNRDYWAPAYLGQVNADGNNRVVAGTTLRVPVVEAKRLIKAGVADRADAFPGDDV